MSKEKDKAGTVTVPLIPALRLKQEGCKVYTNWSYKVHFKIYMVRSYLEKKRREGGKEGVERRVGKILFYKKEEEREGKSKALTSVRWSPCPGRSP